MRHTPDVHLNLNVRGMKRSATVSSNERLAAMERDGKRVYRLGLGQSPFPVPEPVVEALRAAAPCKDYMPVCGHEPLRAAVASHLWRQQGVRRSAADVLIGPGTKELMFLLQLVYYGDLVIPTPSWVSYAPQARIIGRRVVSLPTRAENDWRVTADELDALCAEDPGRPRIVILNYPSNPTGGTYRADELREIARVARRHRFVLLSDEIYGDLHHRGQHVSVARFYPEGTIVSNGISKWCGAGGWRLGAFIFPSDMRWLLEAMAAAASETYTSVAAPIQRAAITAFAGGLWLDEYLTLSRRVLAALGRELRSRLRAAGIDCCRPTGGFYLFPDLGPLREGLAEAGITTSDALCRRLLEETGVGILPGTDFGRPPEELTARIAY
ncbi:MAG: aminotransferase class I/II-fold pyridoxal phosphate-dependent enzyme, partial [Acidobacteria bacterium]